MSSKETPAAAAEEISFSILGNSFTLRCRKEQEAELRQAVQAVQETAARLLRANPTLNPQQAAILSAIDSEIRLQRCLHGSTPFQQAAGREVQELQALTRRALALVKQVH